MRGLVLAAAVLALVNHQRTAHHERTLRPDARLAAIARECPESALASCWRRRGYWTRVVGMNTAWGAKSPREAVELWMASPPHRANILDPRYRRTGVAVIGERYVQVFAAPPIARISSRG